jgi:thymidine phosphorylase
MRVPPTAARTQSVTAGHSGRIALIDNRRLARVAKLAGAPKTAAAGLELHVRLGDRVERGQPLFTLHSDAPGELAYARRYVEAHDQLIDIAVTT